LGLGFHEMPGFERGNTPVSATGENLFFEAFFADFVTGFASLKIPSDP
jgi:hypothetical protein